MITYDIRCVNYRLKSTGVFMAAIAAWYDNFDKNYLSINLNEYENIGMNLPIVKLLLGVAVAFIVAIIIINYSKSNLYLMVKQLMRHGAMSEDSAKTLGEIRLGDNRGIKRALAGSSQMRSIVATAGEEKMSYEEYLMKRKALREAKRAEQKGGFFKRLWAAIVGFFYTKDELLLSEIDFSTARFYIKEEGKDRASKIYNSSEITLIRTVFTCIFVALFFVGLMFAMPEILSWINSILA